jgi:Methyltransferase domain
MISRFKERLGKALHEKNALKRFVARRFLFDALQRFGFHLTASHFYEIIPDTREVARRYSDQPRTLPGIDWHFAECEQRALRLIQTYGSEYPDACGKFGFYDDNPYFAGLDPLMLFLMLRDQRPKKIIEIGQGFSTRIAFAALERNLQESRQPVEFISIDPYQRLEGQTTPELVSLRCIRKELQEVDFPPLLEGCGFLFVDSSHVYKFGSDVAFEFTRIYPLLRPGTTLHLHDIFSPYDFPLHYLTHEKWFWNEPYLLECFLMFNQAFEVALPVNLLARQSAALAEAIQRLRLGPGCPYRGTSFYIARK